MARFGRMGQMASGAMRQGRSVMNSNNANKMYNLMGKKNLEGAARIASGRRRAMWAGGIGAVGMAAERNSVGQVGRSSGGRGYQYPRSSGGYA